MKNDMNENSDSSRCSTILVVWGETKRPGKSFGNAFCLRRDAPNLPPGISWNKGFKFQNELDDEYTDALMTVDEVVVMFDGTVEVRFEYIMYESDECEKEYWIRNGWTGLLLDS